MSKFFCAIFSLFLLTSCFVGCGGGTAEVGGSDLNNDEAKAKADAGRAAYMGGGRGGPGGANPGGPPPGRGN